jgi:hypothetical protein
MIRDTLPKPKEKYKVYNWKQYNEQLKKRGDLTIWMAEDVAGTWVYEGKRERGGKKIYSELAIHTCLAIRKVYHLPLRQTQGMLRSIFRMMSISMSDSRLQYFKPKSSRVKYFIGPTRN